MTGGLQEGCCRTAQARGSGPGEMGYSKRDRLSWAVERPGPADDQTRVVEIFS